MFLKRKTLLYFAPHQDDELLTMGIDISSSVSKKQDVHVILCTDGSKSNVRKLLNNGKNCSKHKGPHIYELTPEEFTKARDREFVDSCHALGVSPSNVHIPENRYIDGSLTVADAETIIQYYLDIYGKDSLVCTISPNNGPSQHRDHKALGKAAENLLKRGIISELKLFIEPYHSAKVLNNAQLLKHYPDIEKASADIEKNIKQAISSYSYWNPEELRYAVGYHSVTNEFNDFLKDMNSYHFTKKEASSMSSLDKFDLKHRRWLKLQKQSQLYYSLDTCEQPDLGDLKLISVYEQNDYKDFCQKYQAKLRDKDLQRIADGSSFWCLVSADEEILSTGWLAYKQHFYIGETDFGFDMDNSNTGLLYDFNTVAEHRGKGYYGLLLKSIVNQSQGPDHYVIYTEPDNYSSSKGILKAGFKHVGTLNAQDGSMKEFLKKEGFTSIKRKNQFWGLRVLK